jgi:protein SDA1
MDYDEDEESSDDDSSDVDKVKSKILNTRIGAKMSRKKKHNLKKTLKNLTRKKDRKGKILFHTDFLPIDLIRCPQEYADKLFYKLRKSTEKLEIKIHMMKFIGRLIGRHKLIMFNFYPFISKYINTHQKELAEILAMVAESTHINVPHEEVSPLIEKILDNFINERATPMNMTIALNAVREICGRNPNAMNKEQLQYCIAYYKIKNKSVSTAIKGLINLFRDLRPELLEKKQLGKDEALNLRSHPAESMVENTRLSTIDGLELLREHEGLPEGVNMLTHRLLTEKDFKLIKMLRLQKKAKEVKEELKLNLKGYEIIDKRYNKENEEHDHENGHNDQHNQEEIGEGEEFDADDEEGEESENEEDIPTTHHTNAKEKYNEDQEKQEHNGKFSEELKMRSDGIKYVHEVDEDVEVEDMSISDSDSDEYVNNNPHNFLDGSCLNTFKKSKYEKMAETYVTKEAKLKLKKEFAKSKHLKEGKSKTNKEKLKNKPMGMVIPKKLKSKFYFVFVQLIHPLEFSCIRIEHEFKRSFQSLVNDL